MMQTHRDFIIIFGLSFAAFIFITIPLMIAYDRHLPAETKKSVMWLCVLSPFFGITWVVALIYACIAQKEKAKN